MARRAGPDCGYYRPEPTASLARMVLCNIDPFSLIVSRQEETMKLNDIDIAKQTVFYLKNGYH
jgi:LEA14-like dessication related protein